MRKVTGFAVLLALVSQIVFIPAAQAKVWLLDRKWEKAQKQSQYNDIVKKYGLDPDTEANEFCVNVSNRLLQQIKKQNKVELDYSVFVIKQKQPNAFAGLGGNIAVTRGMVDMLNGDEDELAAILAHEYGHSIGAHLLDSINGQLWTAVLFNQYLRNNNNSMSKIGAGIAFQQITTKGFGRSHEWAADNYGMRTATAAGYNPAGIAGSFQKFLEKYGDKHVSLLGEILSPEEHPSNKERIENNMKFVTAYSGNLVTVHDEWVFLAKKPVVKPVTAAGKSAKERAYLIAGSLAQALHEGHKEPARYSNGQIRMGTYSIMTVTENDTDGESTAEAINNALNLPNEKVDADDTSMKQAEDA
ncbi:Beta-barrel assembly-enhancing protease [Sporomusa rhizae]|uniref:M48 family metallopeptidase n=1 Tax=Sporomusa rhizae TaxID=357999 RepID=UPI00352B7F62